MLPVVGGIGRLTQKEIVLSGYQARIYSQCFGSGSALKSDPFQQWWGARAGMKTAPLSISCYIFIGCF